MTNNKELIFPKEALYKPDDILQHKSGSPVIFKVISVTWVGEHYINDWAYDCEVISAPVKVKAKVMCLLEKDVIRLKDDEVEQFYKSLNEAVRRK